MSSDLNEKDKPLVIALMGPTASGKTELALQLASILDGEIISVDSVLVYRGLNIGAAKPSAEEQSRARHWLIDIREPSEPYSVADFCADATDAIDNILARGKVPILAGGTMLYFKGLLEGLNEMPPANPEVRANIEQEALAKGWPAIHQQLQEVDPVAAERIHPNHSQRLSRALEVWRVSGKPMSEWQSGFEGGLLGNYNWLQIAIAPSDRSVLHRRIEQRFTAMLSGGFIDEVETLRARGDLHKDLPAIRAVGYRQVWEYLDGDYDFDTMQFKSVVATRQLAKRQLTWLRGWNGLKWLDTQEKDGKMKEIKEIIRECLSFCGKTTI